MTTDIDQAGDDDFPQLMLELELMLAVEAAFDEAYGPAPRHRPAN